MAVLDAAIGLFSENKLAPDLEAIAERSGVSTKSMRRYFEDDDALLRAAIEREVDVGLPQYRIHQIGQGSLDVRIRRFVEIRCRAQEDLAGTARAASLMAVRNPQVREIFDQIRALLADQVGLQFGPELEAMPVATARIRAAMIDALCQFEAIDQLRTRLGWSLEEATSALEETVRHLLEPSRSPP